MPVTTQLKMGAAPLSFLQGCGSFLDLLSAKLQAAYFNDSNTNTKCPPCLKTQGWGTCPLRILYISVIVPDPPILVTTEYLRQPTLVHRMEVEIAKFCVVVPVQPCSPNVSVREYVATEPSLL
jgi:hypothetical protein